MYFLLLLEFYSDLYRFFKTIIWTTNSLHLIVDDTTTGFIYELQTDKL